MHLGSCASVAPTIAWNNPNVPLMLKREDPPRDWLRTGKTYNHCVSECLLWATTRHAVVCQIPGCGFIAPTRTHWVKIARARTPSHQHGRSARQLDSLKLTHNLLEAAITKTIWGRAIQKRGSAICIDTNIPRISIRCPRSQFHLLAVFNNVEILLIVQRQHRFLYYFHQRNIAHNFCPLLQ